MPSGNSNKIILDLCGGTGSWSFPYKEAGYNVKVVDPRQSKIFGDVRLRSYKRAKIHGILAAPPCTHFCSSGAVFWLEKGKEPLLEGLSIVDACLRIILLTQPVWWALENPVGRLKSYIGEPKLYFNPCDYGDPYTKKTCLWGDFSDLVKSKVEPALDLNQRHNAPQRILGYANSGSKISRSDARSITPPGFARAFFEANP